MAVNPVSGSDFRDKIMNAEDPKLKIVKFGASWCGPCRTLAPIMEEVAGGNSDVEFYSVDVDDSSVAAISAEYNISAVPTCIAFRAGKMLESKAGSMSKANLESWINDMKNKQA